MKLVFRIRKALLPVCKEQGIRDTMVDADILGSVIEKFVSPTINLSPNPLLHDEDFHIPIICVDWLLDFYR